MTPMNPFDRLSGLVSRITYPAFSFTVGQDEGKERPYYWLRVEVADGFCTQTGEPMHWCGRKWRLSEHMTDGEVVFTAFKALITALEHEARELFKFDGVAVADPHPDIHLLVAHLKDTNARKLRGRHNA